jgi:hypothetical protein
VRGERTSEEAAVEGARTRKLQSENVSRFSGRGVDRRRGAGSGSGAHDRRGGGDGSVPRRRSREGEAGRSSGRGRGWTEVRRGTALVEGGEASQGREGMIALRP